jgi:hypothetical protein
MRDTLDESMREEVANIVIDALEEADADVFLEGVDPVEVQKSNFDQYLDYRPADEWDQNGLGWTDPDKVASVQDLGIRSGDINESADASGDELIDNEFINQVHDSSGNLEW